MKKRTPQELADFFDCYATISPSGEVRLYEKEPKYSQRFGSWSSPECDSLILSRALIGKGEKNTKNVLFRPHQEPFVFEDTRHEWELGEVFRFKARNLKCTRSGLLGCVKCFMRYSNDCGLLKCRYYERRDGEEVHFEEVNEPCLYELLRKEIDGPYVVETRIEKEKKDMKLYTTRKTDGFQVKDVASMEMGDVFEFDLKDGETVRAMAVKKGDDATDFITVDCLKGKDMAMNLEPTSEGGYDESHLRESLNQEILALFPDDIRDAMVPVYKDDLLAIPSETEIFGETIYSIEDSDEEQFVPMKERRNRIALDGTDGWPGCWWLRDATVANGFAIVLSGGGANSLTATLSLGIRPRFRIANR